MRNVLFSFAQEFVHFSGFFACSTSIYGVQREQKLKQQLLGFLIVVSLVIPSETTIVLLCNNLEVEQGYPLNLSILLSGGKGTN